MRNKNYAPIYIVLLILLLFSFFSYFCFFRKPTSVLERLSEVEYHEEMPGDIYYDIKSASLKSTLTVNEMDLIEDIAYKRVASKRNDLFEILLLLYADGVLEKHGDSIWQKGIAFINDNRPGSDYVLMEIDARIHPVNSNDINLHQLIEGEADQRMLVSIYFALSPDTDVDAELFYEIVSERKDVSEKVRKLYRDWKDGLTYGHKSRD